MTDHEARAREIVKKQFGLFGFDLVLAPKHEAAAIAAAIRSATDE